MRRTAGFALAVALMGYGLALVTSQAASATVYSAPVFTLLATHQQGSSGPAWDQEPGTDLGGNFDHSSPVITKLTPGGPTVAVVGARDGCIYVYKYNAGGGNVYSRFAYEPTFNGGNPVCIGSVINSSPAVADLDGDGNKEIVFGSGKLYQPGEWGEGQKWNGGIHVLRSNGTNYWGGGFVQVVEGVFATPAVGDIDGDGAPDIVWGDFSMHVRAINRNGGDMWSVFIADTVWSSPALTTLPGTNKLATIIGTDLGGGNPGGILGCPQVYNGYLVRGLLLALNEAGNMISGYPKCLDTPIWSSPSLTDLNNDGRVDAVFATNNYFENGAVVGNASRVYAIDLWWPTPLGQMAPLPGWPVNHTGADAKSWSTPAVADMNGDGWKEVAVGNTYNCPAGGGSGWNCGAMFLFGANGAMIWARTTEFENRTVMSSPVMADVNGDGRPEAIFGGGDWRIHAMDFAGNYAAEFYTGCTAQQPSECNAGRQFRNAVAVGDMTGDGKIDIFAAGGTHDNPSKGQVWLLTGPTLSTAAPWPFFKHDETRQNCDEGTTIVGSCPSLMPVVKNMSATAGDQKVNVAWTNPAAPNVTGIKLLRKTASCSTDQNDGTSVQDSLGTTFNDAGLTNGTKYFYTAFTHDGSGNFSKGVCVNGTPAPPPAAPSAISSRAEDQQDLLFWTNPVGNNFAGVRVVRKAGASPPANIFDGTTVYDGPATTYTDVGVSNGSQYSYGLFSHNAIPEFSAPGTASITPNPHSGPSYSVYFAEGSTGNGSFNSVDYITLGNIAATDSVVTFTYMFKNQGPMEKTYTVPANKRITVRVNNDVGNGKDVSVRLATRSGPGVIAERPMYFAGDPGTGYVDGGHAAVGVTVPRNNWYLAEGYVAPGWAEYVTILNPSSEAAATVQASYVFSSGAPLVKPYTIQPNSRKTLAVGTEISPKSGDVSISLGVTGGPPVIAERAVYFRGDPGLGVGLTGGHVHAGAPGPAADWYFAEGYTGGGFVEYLTLQNPNPQPTDITATYVFQGGAPPVDKHYVVPANTRKTLRVNDEIGPNQQVSVHIQVWAGEPQIVVERPMYFSADPALGASVDGGHDVVGANAPGGTFDFAEGYTGAGFVEYLTIQNPSPSQADITATYVFNSGAAPKLIHYSIAANSRKTIRVNSQVPAGQEVSVLAATWPGSPAVLIERPMYFAADPGLGNFVSGGHDVVGYQPPP